MFAHKKYGGPSMSGRYLKFLFFLNVSFLFLSSCMTTSPFALPPKSRRLPSLKGSESGITRVVRANFDDIRGCYDNARQKDPKLEGTVVVEFSVEPGKPPKPVGIRGSTLQNKYLDECILAQFKKWDFPEERGAKSQVMLTYPLELKP
jgi:hypothetical protein